MAEQRLRAAFPRVPPAVVTYILGTVAGDNYQIAHESLSEMTPDAIAELERSLRFSTGTVAAQLTAPQKELLQQFKGIAGCSDKIGVRYLSNNGWDLETALNGFFSNPPEPEPEEPAAASAGPNQLEALHAKFLAVAVREGADESSTVLQGAGLIALSDEIDKSDPELPLMILAWKVDAKTPFQLSKAEFVDGLTGLGVKNIPDLQRAIALWRGEFRNEVQFRSFYKFTFEWTRSGANAKSLEFEQACDLWKLLLSDKVPWLEGWLHFVQTTFKKAITRDVWLQFLDFSKLRADFSDYDSESAWPVLFDEFVDATRSAAATR